VVGSLSEGFRLPDARLVVITEIDLFGEARRRRRARGRIIRTSGRASSVLDFAGGS